MKTNVFKRLSYSQHGQAMAEYIVGCIVVMIVLGALWSKEKGSVIDILLKAIQDYYTGLSSFLSIPL